MQALEVHGVAMSRHGGVNTVTSTVRALIAAFKTEMAPPSRAQGSIALFCCPLCWPVPKGSKAYVLRFLGPKTILYRALG